MHTQPHHEPKAPPRRPSFPHRIKPGTWLNRLTALFFNVARAKTQVQADGFIGKVLRSRRSRTLRKGTIHHQAARNRQDKRRRRRQKSKGQR